MIPANSMIGRREIIGCLNKSGLNARDIQRVGADGTNAMMFPSLEQLVPQGQRL